MSRWWYISKGEKRGPVGEEQLRHLLRAGTVTAGTLLWKSGMRDWQPAARIDELVLLLKLLPLPPIQQNKSLKSLPLPPIRQNNSIGAWRRVRRHLGSSIALALGCLGVIVALPSLAHAVENPHLATLRGDTLMGGAVMILGALAYRSAKKRKIGEAKSTLMRYFWEITLLVPIFVVIFAVILRPNNFSYLIETNPVQNLLIAIGAIAAYVIACIRATARPMPVFAKESFRLPRSSRVPH